MSDQVYLAIADADLRCYGFEESVVKRVINYVCDNAEYMHEVTPSMVTKVAELVFLCDDDEWEIAADMVVLSHKGRIEKFMSGEK